jgi:FkbM family methyltransferase
MIIQKFFLHFPKIKYYLIKYFAIPKLRYHCINRGIKLKISRDFFDFIDKNRILRVSRNHLLYCFDIVNSYNFYYSAVEPINFNGFQLVDYSMPRYHNVIGFNKHPILFPSFSEPLAATLQYLDFAKLSSGSVVLDLGAYSGLTSILFKEKVGRKGEVVSVEIDDRNLDALDKNLLLYLALTGNKIRLVKSAIWSHNRGIEFSVEGNMGSSATDILGKSRFGSALKKVPSLTLSSLAKKLNLRKIDFIKCDIEGAESVIFKDSIFFKKFKPKIIIETHMVGGINTLEKVKHDLGCYGYKFKIIKQKGISLPLIECTPKNIK